MSPGGLFALFGIAVGAAAALAFLAFTVRVWLTHRKYSHIPGPPRSSFYLGNLLQIGERFRKGSTLGETLFNWCMQYGDTYVMYFMNAPKVFTADPDAVKSVFITENFPKPERQDMTLKYVFNNRFAGASLGHLHNHEEWAARRTIMNPAFSRNLLKPLMCDFNQVSDEFMAKLADKADGQTVTHLLDEVHRTTFDILGKVAFAMDLNSLRDDGSPIKKAIGKAFEGFLTSFTKPLQMMNPFGGLQLKRETKEACDMLRECARKQIQDRREAMERGDYVPEDVLTYMIKCQDSIADPKEAEEITIDQFVGFFVAGTETTTYTISSALLELGRHPEVFAKLRQEVDEVLGERSVVNFEDLSQLVYCDVVIKETLRLYPPAAFNQREVNRDGYKIGPYDIPKGTLIYVSTYVTGRLEKHHTDALDFKPERFLNAETKPSSYTTFPFTLGPRACIGQNLAKMEAKVMLSKFVQRFDMKLDPTQSFDFIEDLALRPKDGVRATLTLRT